MVSDISTLNTVTDIDDLRISYRFVQETCKTERGKANGELIKNENVLIMIERKKGNSVIHKVHPVSEYLFRHSNNNKKYKINSLKKTASYLVKFLNYTVIENGAEYKIEDVWDLTFEHGELFLNKYSLSGVALETVLACEEVLKNFYFFLANKNVLKNISIGDFSYKVDESGTVGSLESPFKGIIYPEEQPKNIEHDLPFDLVVMFIDTAMLHTPNIALGVYFQFFGGLRVGEVVNTAKSTLSLKGPFGRYGIVINLKNKNLRRKLKHSSSGGAVKKPRKQIVYPYKAGLLEKLYKKHISSYLYNQSEDALFINAKGLPMTDASYIYYFNKLKDIFITRLKNSNDIVLKQVAVNLQSRKWSTHIGRGVFSNMIAEVAENIAQIRQARGDSSWEASFSYLTDSSKMAIALSRNQNDMWKMLMEEVKQYKKLKEKGEMIEE